LNNWPIKAKNRKVDSKRKFELVCRNPGMSGLGDGGVGRGCWAVMRKVGEGRRMKVKKNPCRGGLARGAFRGACGRGNKGLPLVIISPVR